MHLVSCARPNEPLEDAPCSSLTIDAAKGAWTGYWSTMDEGYYARCQHPDGSEEWFRMYEEGIGIRATPLGSVAAIALGFTGKIDTLIPVLNLGLLVVGVAAVSVTIYVFYAPALILIEGIR